MESTQIPVRPVNPAAPYIGGKRNLAKRLAVRIAATPHTTYAEAFVGMGGVFFRRTSQPKCEVINDYSGDIANFFRILQRHHTPFVEMLRYQVTARKDFERLSRAVPDTLTDLERAARFLYLQKTAFGGKRRGQSFGVSLDRPARFDVSKIVPQLADIHERLSGVNIECLPYQSFIERYDRPGTLFYLDPPYWGCEDDYGKEMFARSDFEAMAAQLSKIKGKFIMSINDLPEIRDTFKAFNIEAVNTTYTLSSKGAGKAKELIISNTS